MSRLEKDKLVRRLDRIFGQTNDSEFLELVWCIDALQSGRAAVLPAYFSFPEEANTQDQTSNHFVHKWALETLANRCLSTRKKRLTDGANQVRIVNGYSSLAEYYNLLREIEGLEYALRGEADPYLEMIRVLNRQIQWQLPGFSPAQYFRSAYLFTGPHCRNKFLDFTGLDIIQFMKIGLLISVKFLSCFKVPSSLRFRNVGISQAEYNAFLSKVSLSHKKARALADRYRREGQVGITYSRSVFREYPCVVLDGDKELAAPFSDLLIKRTTTGLYYDVVTSGGPIATEIGERFEEYFRKLFTAAYPNFNAHSEYEYRVEGRNHRTPDLLVKSGDNLVLVVECKAKRLPFEEQFGDTPIDEEGVGFKELVKGVFQIWKFHSHVRQGHINEKSDRPILNLIITQDHWTRMAGMKRNVMFDKAAEMADNNGAISMEDRVPVAFCSIEDFEFLSMTCDQEMLWTLIEKCAEPEFFGHDKMGLRSELFPDSEIKRAYALEDQIIELLPWWREIFPN